jgi:hypothetical protein
MPPGDITSSDVALKQDDDPLLVNSPFPQRRTRSAMTDQRLGGCFRHGPIPADVLERRLRDGKSAAHSRAWLALSMQLEYNRREAQKNRVAYRPGRIGAATGSLVPSGVVMTSALEAGRAWDRV